MEEENIQSEVPAKEIIEEPIEEVLDASVVPEEVQQDPLELISEEFKKLEGEINTLKRYCKTLAEEVRKLQDNFKLLLEETSQ